MVEDNELFYKFDGNLIRADRARVIAESEETTLKIIKSIDSDIHDACKSGMTRILFGKFGFDKSDIDFLSENNQKIVKVLKAFGYKCKMIHSGDGKSLLEITW
jgi:hypothetical protein